jgi:D-serine deaminase-like pyridoxal phosphate-dependent protein
MPTTLRNTDILFNDGTTQGTAATAGGLVTTANVLNATAGASLGAVGTYAFLVPTTGVSTNPGVTKAGSALRYSDTSVSAFTGTTPTGTWRCMGYDSSLVCGCTGINFVRATVWLRIS